MKGSISASVIISLKSFKAQIWSIIVTFAALRSMIQTILSVKKTPPTAKNVNTRTTDATPTTQENMLVSTSMGKICRRHHHYQSMFQSIHKNTAATLAKFILLSPKPPQKGIEIHLYYYYIITAHYSRINTTGGGGDWGMARDSVTPICHKVTPPILN